MPVKLYKSDTSPPARATMMALEIFGVPAELVDVNFMKQEHLTPEYLKKNPLHSVPVLEDGSVIVHDSQAILIYLAEAYGKNDSIYPKDAKQRALINQILFFNASVLFNKLRNVTVPAMMEGQRKLTDKQKTEIVEAYGFLEEFLSRNKYVAGSQLTIADVACFATTTSLNHIVPIDAKFRKIHAWIKELENKPYSQKCNTPGLGNFGHFIKSIIDF